MPRIRWFALAAVLMAGSLAVAACGGSSKKTDNTPTAAAEKASGDSTPASGKTSTSGKTAEATKSGSSSDGDSEVKAIGRKFAQSTFNATYKITGSGADEFSDGTLTLLKDGEKKFRFDLTAKQDGKDMSIIFIEADGVSAFCLKDAGEFGALLGIESGEGVCFKTGSNDQNNPVGSLRDSLKEFENADVIVIEKSSKKVAGQEGQCFKTKDNETEEISTTCFNKDGVILYVQTEGDAASEIEAQTVSKSVSDDDFKLPYEERELPGGLGGE